MPIEPGMPDVLVEHGNVVYRSESGRESVAPHVIVDERTWGELVEGYRCMRCFHVQSEPMPERCEFVVELAGARWQCPMRIRDDQVAELVRTYRGEADYSPPDPYQSLDDERDYWKPTRFGLVIPNKPLAS